MEGNEPLTVGGRNNKLKSAGRTLRVSALTEGSWRLGLHARAGATRHGDSM